MNEKSPETSDSPLEFGSSDEVKFSRNQLFYHKKSQSNTSSLLFSQAEKFINEIQASPPSLSPERKLTE